MGTMTGGVLGLSVFGRGQNSALLEFTLDDGTSNQTFVVTAYPGFEPQVFAGMTALLTAAYYAQKKVQISYYEVANQTPCCTSVATVK